MIVWVLAGNLMTLPFESKQIVRQANLNKKIFAKTKLVIKSNPFTETICVFDNNTIGLISRFRELERVKLLSYDLPGNKKTKYFIVNLQNNNKLVLRKDLSNRQLENSLFYIGKYLSKLYSVKTAGNLYSIDLNKNLFTRSKVPIWTELNKGGIYLWLPEETYKQLASTSLINSQQGKFIRKDYWLGQNIFSPINGLIHQGKQNRKVYDVSILSGTIFTFKKILLILKIY